MARPEVCDQPWCALRRPGADAGLLVDLVVAALAGEDVRERLDPDSCIEPHARCVTCVERVMRGARPLTTVAEQERKEDVAHWSWRRARRRRPV